jgi:hypothetical protein
VPESLLAAHCGHLATFVDAAMRPVEAAIRCIREIWN